RPEHRHRLPRWPVRSGHGPTARSRRYGPYHDVPGHRLRRSPRPHRLRRVLPRPGLRTDHMRKIRLLLAALAVGVVALLGLTASPAAAVDTEEACLARAVHDHGITEEAAADLTDAQSDAIA